MVAAANPFLSAEDILGLGLLYRRIDMHRFNSVNVEAFRDAYGIDPMGCAQLLHDLRTTDIQTNRIDNPSTFDLLMAMYWLKQYLTEKVIAREYKVDGKKTSKKILKYVRAIQALKQVKIVWRLDDGDGQPTIGLSVDGVHCQIEEPRMEPDAKWCSFKFKKPALAYELGLELHDDQLCWIHGPFKGGTPDVDIFTAEGGLREKLLASGKRAIADRGYSGHEDVLAIRNQFDTDEVRAFKRRARARHEAFNSHLKTFCALKHPYRHGWKTHEAVFDAICVLLQYDMENGRPLFAI